MSEMLEYHPTDPLVPGLTLLEASAGTGKTYGIENLVVRLVAEEGVAMREIAVVTYTRAATAELRDRIRRRLGLALAVLDGRATAGGDAVLEALLAADVAERLPRLRAAVDTFDECLLSTIHGFCQRMLQQNAFESGSDFDLELVTDDSRLLEELVDDFLSRELYADDPQRFRFLTEHCGFSRTPLLALARAAVSDPDLELRPDPEEVDGSSWDRTLASVARRWQESWAAELPDELEAANKRGVFTNPKQLTYRKTRAGKEVPTFTAWLANRPPFGDIPSNHSYWTRKLREQLPAGAGLTFSAAMSAIDELFAVPARVAACERARFVRWVRGEMERRNAERRAQGYQDLVRGLARTLRSDADPAERAALVGAVGARFRAALIDEFQDTDDLQWTIFHGLFGGGAHWLYLIGDPKQAIYGFRGANVHVYLEAKRVAGERVFTMSRNYRSDARLLRALNHVMHRPGFFGELAIPYVPVDAPPREPSDRLRFGPDTPAGWRAPLQLRFVDADLDGGGDGPLGKGRAKELLPGRVAADVAELLLSGAEIHSGRDGFRGVRPGDVAVLVRTGAQAADIQAALGQLGIPAVLTGAESVLASEEALDVQRWLRALDEGRDGPARVCATTRLFGRTALDVAQVDAQDEAAISRWDRWLERLAAWRATYAIGGFLRAFRQALDDEGVEARLLCQPGGERRLTNLRHVSELLHEAESEDRLQLSGLLAWLQRERARPSGESERLELRLERDDEAVTVMTVHKSKGLQFSIVFAPYLWDAFLPKESDAFHVVPHPERPHRRILDLRADRRESAGRALLESRKEGVRNLYVAVTRARHRCVLYAGHLAQLHEAPVASALHGEPRDGSTDRLAAAWAREDATRDALWADLVALADGSAADDGAPTIAVSRCDPPQPGPRWTPPDAIQDELRARGFARYELDATWRRYSYSALTAGRAVTYRQDDADRDGMDVDALPELPAADPTWTPRITVPDDAPDVPLARFPAGPAAGTFLHEVFERADFTWVRDGGDLDALLRVLRERLPLHGFDAETWAIPLANGLRDVLRTPLGGALGDARLCDIPKKCRFDELRFDFPIAGGIDAARGQGAARVESEHIVGALGVRKRLGLGPDDERLVRAAYLAGLGDFGTLAGFMTGSIDLVFRHPVAGHDRWFVADYKSNRLDPHGHRRWPVQHFCGEGMRYEMEQHHYYVQYHIYALALHRYLRWRVPGYDYERDFGGVYYLFFRGMIGETTPIEGDTRAGCFFDRPPRAVIEALDAVFRGGAAVRA